MLLALLLQTVNPAYTAAMQNWRTCLTQNVPQLDAPGEPATVVADAVMAECGSQESQVKSVLEADAPRFGIRPNDPFIIQDWQSRQKNMRSLVTGEVLRGRVQRSTGSKR